MESGQKRAQNKIIPEEIFIVYVDYEAGMVRVNTSGNDFFGMPVERINGQPVVRLEVFKERYEILEN